MVKPSASLWTSITSTPSRSPPRRVRLEIVQLTSPGNFNSAEVMENPSKWTSRETSVSIQLFVAMMHHPIKRRISPQSPNESGKNILGTLVHFTDRHGAAEPQPKEQ